MQRKDAPRKTAFLAAAFLLCLLPSLVLGQGQVQELETRALPTVAPEEVGFSAERLDRIGSVFQQEIDDGALIGMVTLVARHGKVAYFETLGQRDREAGEAMPEDAIFRIASMSKPITSVAAMILMEEGRFLLDDPVSRFIPAFAETQVAVVEDPTDPASSIELVPAERRITIRHLLSHTSGLTYGAFNRGPVGTLYREAQLSTRPATTLAEFASRVAELPLVHQPGTAWEYGVSTDILGAVVEAASGMPFEKFLEERIFRPLGMKDTGFFVPDEKADRLVALYEVRGTRNLAPTAGYVDARKKPPLPSGGGGLVSTAADYARFLQMLLGGGQLDGVRILSRKSVELMTADHVADLSERGILGDDLGFGLGFSVRGPLGDSGVLGSPGSYSWGGIYNTFFWVDPEQDLFAVAMTQINPFGYLQLNDRFRVLTYQAIAD